MSGKKRAQKSSDGGDDFWNSVKGWKPVEMGDEFLMGGDEDGFMGLEELDPSCLEGVILGPDLIATAAAAAGNTTAKAKDSKKKGKKKAAAATKKDETPETVESLKAKLEALKAENKQLKKKRKKSDSEINDVEEDDDAKPLKQKKKKKAATKESAAADQKQDDKNAVRVDVSAWRDFHLGSGVMDALSIMGFSAPTHVQAECLPAAIRDRRDVIGAAQTGSGKTLAFGLPIMQLLSQRRADATTGDTATRSSSLRALVLAPTRELAMQVCDHLTAVGRHIGVWVVPIVGGISQLKQERLLSKHPEVVVATPGRLWDMMKEGQPHVAGLGGLEFLVIDEADRMVQQGHFSELSSILDAVAAAQRGQARKARAAAGEEDWEDEEGNDREVHEDEDEAEKGAGKGGKKKNSSEARMQTFVFSATLTLPTDMRHRLKKGGGGASGSASLESLMDQIPFSGRGQPKIVDLTSQRRIADKVTEACISCPEAERDEYLYCLLVAHPGRTIVFVNAVSAVRRLAAILKLLGLPVHSLHAGMQQRARLKALDRFKADCNGVLVATDVAARGLDVKDVLCVVHYQLPASVDIYVHRSGRTARAEAEGIAIALVTPKEDARHRALLRTLSREDPPEFPLDESLLGAARERVRLAVRLDSLTRKESKERADKSWRRMQAEALDLIISDADDTESEREERGSKNTKKKGKKEAGNASGGLSKEEMEAEQLKAQLGALLAEPLQPKFSQKYFTGGAAAGVKVQQESSQRGQQQQQAKNKKKNKKGGAGNGNTGVSDGKDSGPDHATIKSAVKMAQRLSDSRAVAGKKGAAADNKAASKAASKTAAKKPFLPRKKVNKKAALAAALKKQLEKKGLDKRSGMFVVPQALGRETQGPGALEALRQRLGRHA